MMWPFKEKQDERKKRIQDATDDAKTAVKDLTEALRKKREERDAAISAAFSVILTNPKGGE